MFNLKWWRKQLFWMSKNVQMQIGHRISINMKKQRCPWKQQLPERRLNLLGSVLKFKNIWILYQWRIQDFAWGRVGLQPLTKFQKEHKIEKMVYGGGYCFPSSQCNVYRQFRPNAPVNRNPWPLYIWSTSWVKYRKNVSFITNILVKKCMKKRPTQQGFVQWW